MVQILGNIFRAFDGSPARNPARASFPERYSSGGNVYRTFLIVSALILSGCGMSAEEGLATCAPIVERDFAQLKREWPTPITPESERGHRAEMTKECMARLGLYFNREKFDSIYSYPDKLDTKTYSYPSKLDTKNSQEIEDQAYMRADFYL